MGTRKYDAAYELDRRFIYELPDYNYKTIDFHR